MKHIKDAGSSASLNKKMIHGIYEFIYVKRNDSVDDHFKGFFKPFGIFLYMLFKFYELL